MIRRKHNTMDEHLSLKEQGRRKEIFEQAQNIVLQALPVEVAEGAYIVLDYSGFYLQIAFSPLHPLMVFYLARRLEGHSTQKERRLINELNLRGVLGSYAINDDVGCYSYRSTHWLDTELSKERFLEILGRCTEEAMRGYSQLMEAA